MIEGNVIKGIERIAVCLARNNTKISIPCFMYKVKRPKKIEEHIQKLILENKRKK